MSPSDAKKLAEWQGNVYGSLALLGVLYSIAVFVKRGDFHPLVYTLVLILTFTVGGVFGKHATLGGLLDNDMKGTDDAKKSK